MMNTIRIKVLWGSYTYITKGIFGLTRVWNHNENLDMTKEEQFADNKRNFPDFCLEIDIPSSVKIRLE